MVGLFGFVFSSVKTTAAVHALLSTCFCTLGSIVYCPNCYHAEGLDPSNSPVPTAMSAAQRSWGLERCGGDCNQTDPMAGRSGRWCRDPLGGGLTSLLPRRLCVPKTLACSVLSSSSYAWAADASAIKSAKPRGGLACRRGRVRERLGSGDH